ncbi:DUF806 family protein [Levilactobacillus brevis]|uniref:DUF806 family protein n=1 Tax=Levilactobacillus brevis TaxID=1580 RepID=UPI001122CC71|nr:DUF806 family protein [Levilactobacillus brevis]MUV40584.1 DUF806 family protein [Levilactobacillus brevis]TOY76907.1 phage tail protein [Levilactobacillus brevis]
MTLPTIEVSKILETVDWITGVYTGLLPEDASANTSDTLALVTEATPEFQDWGNDTFNAVSYSVEVQVFYSLDFDQDVQAVELALLKQLELDGWRIATVRPHSIDPETGQLTETIYVANNKFI